jgi:outer membrane lipoprotein-sorting protein
VHFAYTQVLLLILVAVATTAQQPAAPQFTTDQIVSKLTERNRERAANLKGYTGNRTYRLEYHGFPGSKSAEMIVEARYIAPSEKQFRIVSESGSKLILNRVFHRLLTSEQEALDPENQRETAITTDNYNFKLEREEQDNDRRNFVLHVEPKRKNKFLFRGLIWVDAHDFAVSRIEAEPAKNPSFWISKTSVQHRYMKVGDFWLPAQNISKTDVRLGGDATLTIDYRDYVISTQVAQKQ